ncbi:hypothetical protein Efla_004691 [Eimeria flavescens]
MCRLAARQPATSFCFFFFVFLAAWVVCLPDQWTWAFSPQRRTALPPPSLDSPPAATSLGDLLLFGWSGASAAPSSAPPNHAAAAAADAAAATADAAAATADAAAGHRQRRLRIRQREDEGLLNWGEQTPESASGLPQLSLSPVEISGVQLQAMNAVPAAADSLSVAAELSGSLPLRTPKGAPLLLPQEGKEGASAFLLQTDADCMLRDEGSGRCKLSKAQLGWLVAAAVLLLLLLAYGVYAQGKKYFGLEGEKQKKSNETNNTQTGKRVLRLRSSGHE